MNKYNGFTLIELVMFIIITSLLASAIMLTYVSAISNVPTLVQNMTATLTARQCADWYLGQRRLNGYTNLSGSNCTNPLTLPGVCTVPSGYTLTASCSQTTIRGDTNYQTLTFSVSGPAGALLTLLMSNY